MVEHVAGDVLDDANSQDFGHNFEGYIKAPFLERIIQLLKEVPRTSEEETALPLQPLNSSQYFSGVPEDVWSVSCVACEKKKY